MTIQVSLHDKTKFIVDYKNFAPNEVTELLEYVKIGLKVANVKSIQIQKFD